MKKIIVLLTAILMIMTTSIADAQLATMADGSNPLSYQWQALKPGGEWKNSGLKGNKTATLSVDATDARNGYKFRCVITDSKGNSVISSDAELTVTDPVQ